MTAAPHMPSPATTYPFSYRWLAGLIGTVGVTLILVALTSVPRVEPVTWVLFGAMSALSALIVFQLPLGITYNPQSGVSLAALYLFGWQVPVILSALSLGVFWIRVKRPLWRAAFDLGNVVMSIAFAAIIAPVGVVTSGSSVFWPFIVAGGLYAVASTFFTLIGRLVQMTGAAVDDWQTGMRALMLSAGMVPVGFAIGLLFQALGNAGALLGFASWLLASMALKGNYDARAAGARLAEANHKLEEALVAVERLSITDPLTGLYNRRHFRIRLEEEFRRETRDETPFSLVLLDVIGFKAVNDRHGHLVGDVVLQQFARLLDGAVRPGDLVFRFGGDEFAIILPRTDRVEASAVIDRLTELVAQTSLTVGNQRVSLEVDAGAATGPADGADADALIARADAAMYEARARSRQAKAVSPAGSGPAGVRPQNH